MFNACLSPRAAASATPEECLGASTERPSRSMWPSPGRRGARPPRYFTRLRLSSLRAAARGFAAVGLPTGGIQVQTNPTGTALYEDTVNVRFSASSAVLTNGTQGWPDMGSTTGSGAYNLVQLISRNMYDTQLFASWFY